MTAQLDKIKLFHKLHSKHSPLILFNVWDAGTAIEASESGAKAIGTSSWSVAASHGYEDGQKIPFKLLLDHVCRIIKSVDTPITIDLEAGYGHIPDDVREAVREIALAGAAGINLEDQNIDIGTLYTCSDQCQRIQAARKATSMPVFINARTDIFLKMPPDQHTNELLEEALLRMHAYKDAGADGFFVPGLKDKRLIRNLCHNSVLPINIMVDSPSLTSQELVEMGVSRVSYGPAPYIDMIHIFKQKVREAIEI